MGKEKTSGLTRDLIGEVYDLHFKELYLVARRYLDEEGARDVVQEVFLHLMEKAEETDIHTSLRSYLYRAVIHTCLNHLKHDKVKEEYALEFRIRLLEDEQKRLEERGDVLMMEKELLLQVQQVVASLPEKNKKIFEMSRFGGLSHREIAEKMNISVRTVETQIYRALKTLYRELKDFRGS